MSWKRITGTIQTDTGYLWLYDKMFGTVELVYVGTDEVLLGDLDPDYTHWMYDGESSEEPPPPRDN